MAALGDVIKIDSKGTTQYTTLDEAIASLGTELFENTTIELTNTTVQGPVLFKLKNEHYLLTVKSSTGVAGRIEGVTWGFWIQEGKNITIKDIEIYTTSSLGAIRLGASYCDSIFIYNCELTGNYGVECQGGSNITVRNCNMKNNSNGIMSFTGCKNLHLESNTFEGTMSSTVALQINSCEYVYVADMLFDDGSYNETAIKTTDSTFLQFDRLTIKQPSASSNLKAIEVNKTLNDYSVEDLLITNCVFDSSATKLDLRSAKRVKILNNTFIIKAGTTNNMSVIYSTRLNDTSPYGDSMTIRNNVFSTSSGGASNVYLHRVYLDPVTSVKDDLDIDNNLYYSTYGSAQYQYGTTSNSSSRTLTSLKALQTWGKDIHSFTDSTYNINATYYLTAGSLGLDAGNASYQEYLQNDGRIRPTVTPDIGANDNDSTTYADVSIPAFDFYCDNVTTGEIGNISDSEFFIAEGDSVFIIPVYEKYAVNFSWSFDDDINTSIRRNGKYINFTQGVDGDVYTVKCTISNSLVSTFEEKIDYLGVEKLRPIADFIIYSADSPITTSSSIDLISTSVEAETYFWEVEAAPNQDYYNEYTTEDVLNMTNLITPGQHNIKLTVYNEDTETGERENQKVLIKAISIVDPSTLVYADVEIESNEICRQGDAVTFSITNKNPNFSVVSYEWRFNGADIANSTSATPSAVYNVLGSYDVACKVTLTNGNSSWKYARRQISVVRSLSGRTTHQIALSTLPDNPGKTRFKLLDFTTISGLAPGHVIEFTDDLTTGQGLYISGLSPDGSTSVVGTEADPIIITNKLNTQITISYSYTYQSNQYVEGIFGDYVQYVIFDFRNFSNMTNNSYGLKITTPDELETSSLNGGFRMKMFSTDVEWFGIYVEKSGFPGFQMHTEPTQQRYYDGNWDPNWERPEWPTFVCKNINAHHNKIDECKGEGFYLGYSYIRYVDGTTTRPHKNENGLVYRNIIKEAHRDGIQYGNGTGIWEIHDNYLLNVNKYPEANQANAFQINAHRENCASYIYNNKVDGFYANGFDIKFAKNQYIFNNSFCNNKSGGSYGLYFNADGIDDIEKAIIVNNTWENQINDKVLYFNMTDGNTGESFGPVSIETLVLKNNLHTVDISNEISPELDNMDELLYADATKFYGYQGQDLWAIAFKIADHNIFRGFENSGQYVFNNGYGGDKRIQPASIAANTGTDVSQYFGNALTDIGLLDYEGDGYLTPMNSSVMSVGAFQILTSNGALQPDIGEIGEIVDPGPGGGEIIPPSEVYLGDVSDPCDYVKGGLKSISLATFDPTVVWVFDENGVIIGANNQQLEFTTIRTNRPLAIYKGPMTIDRAGIYYAQSITIGFTKMRQEVRNLISSTTNQKFYIIGTDESGAKWLYGQTHGLRISDMFETNNLDVNGYSLVLSGINLFEANRIIIDAATEPGYCDDCDNEIDGEIGT